MSPVEAEGPTGEDAAGAGSVPAGAVSGAVGPDPLAAALGRLDELERRVGELRRLRAFAVLAAVSAGLVTVAALSVWVPGRRWTPTASVLRAESFELVDSLGQPRGLWSVDTAGAGRMSLFDAVGTSRLRLTVLGSGAPGLSLADDRGRPRTVLGVLPDASSSLVFADQSGDTRIVLGLTSGEAGTLLFSDARGETLASFGLPVEGSSAASRSASPSNPPAIPGLTSGPDSAAIERAQRPDTLTGRDLR